MKWLYIQIDRTDAIGELSRYFYSDTNYEIRRQIKTYHAFYIYLLCTHAHLNHIETAKAAVKQYQVYKSGFL